MPDLDPRTPDEWEAFRRAGYRLVDQIITLHQQLREGPCWQSMPGANRRELEGLPPRAGAGVEAVLERAQMLFGPYATGNVHPRFWGWVIGAGTLPGLLGQWLSSAINANAWAGDQSSCHVELEVLKWFITWFEFPERASGLLLEGASTANALALAVARHRATQGRVKREGLRAQPGLRIYASTAVHNSVIKSAELLGFGSDAVRLTPADPQGRADPMAIERAILEDRRAGAIACCIVASAGTVGTGAIDPLRELRALADRHGTWFHVDAAIGAPAFLSPSLRPRLDGMQAADSLAFDLHKWAQVPYDAGCLLVRDPDLHRATFAFDADYLSSLAGGLCARGAPGFNALGPQLSRADRALKIWSMFHALGTERIVAVFEQNVRQAHLLAALVGGSPLLEVVSPVHLNIVCLRLRGLPVEVADERNERLLVALQQSGVAVLSSARIEGRFCLRASICNHRTRDEDLELLVDTLETLTRRLELHD